jgi:hypothetical protein
MIMPAWIPASWPKKKYTINKVSFFLFTHLFIYLLSTSTLITATTMGCAPSILHTYKQGHSLGEGEGRGGK